MRVIAGAFILSIFAVPTVAAGPGGAVREACKADVAALCAGIQPGGGRIKECMKANKDKLSEGCKAAVAAMIQARREAKAAAAPQPVPSTQTPPPVTSPVVP